jgi:hypothetical protein
MRDANIPPEKPLADKLAAYFKELSQDVLDIINAKVEILKLDVQEFLVRATSSIIAAFLGLIGVIYLFTFIAIFLGEVLGRLSLGFLIMSIVMLAVAGFIAKFRGNAIENFIRNRIMKITSFNNPDAKPKDK